MKLNDFLLVFLPRRTKVNRLRDKIEEEKTKQKRVLPAINCPASLPNIEIRSFSVEDETYSVCATYLSQSGNLLSKEYCSRCKYNPNEVRRVADEKLQRVYEEALRIKEQSGN